MGLISRIKRILGIKSPVVDFPTRDLFMNYSPERKPDVDEVRAYYDRFLEHMKGYEDTLPNRFKLVFEEYEKLIKPGMTVLDLGCGTGITTGFITQLGAKPVGVDISPKIIEFAQEKRPDIEFICSDVTALRINRKFDFISMIDMLEHIPCDKRPALWDMVAIHANPGALLLINLPCAEHILNTRKRGEQAFQIVDEAVPVKDVMRELKNVGFEKKSLRYLSLSSSKDTVQMLFCNKPL